MACPISEYLSVLRKNITHKKILTAEARRIIANAHLHGVYSRAPGDTEEPCEPPYMAPSEDPNDYPAVRTILRVVPF